MTLEKLLFFILGVAILAWLFSFVSACIGLREHHKLIRKYKLPKPDFYNPITNEMQQSYWQKINGIETQ